MAQNEALARRINDRIEYQRPRNGESADTFVCECVRVDCGGVLDLSIGEYARVRSHPRRFIVLPGHEEPAVESTVEVYPGYVVVEKRGEAGRLAEAEAGGQPQLALAACESAGLAARAPTAAQDGRPRCVGAKRHAC